MLGIKLILALGMCVLTVCTGRHSVLARERLLCGDEIVKKNDLSRLCGQKGCLNLSQMLYFKNKKIWIVGDSLMVGWDGTKLLKNNCPKLISQALRPKVINNRYSFSGAQISGNRNQGTVDLTNNVSQIILNSQFKSVDILLLSLGINDLNYSDNNIGYIQQRLQANIIRLKSNNSNVVIIGILPFESYLKTKKRQYQLQEMRAALTEVYQSFGIPVLSWQQAGFFIGYSSLNDGVHPKYMTYRRMSTTIINFMIQNKTTQPIVLKKQRLFVSNGWQTNEQGYRQYAKNNILLTDWQKIGHTNYYFDPINKSVVFEK